MKDLIEYISQIFGLEMKSTIAIMEMELDIGEINNHADYVRYLKNGFNLDDIKYLTAYQKFLTLTKRYKMHEIEAINAKRLSSMGELALKLSSKVLAWDMAILNHPHKSELKWEHLKSIDDVNKNHFGEKEIKALRSIGEPIECINLQRRVSGRDLLMEKLDEIFKIKVLEDPTQVLIGNIANIAKEKQI